MVGFLQRATRAARFFPSRNGFLVARLRFFKSPHSLSPTSGGLKRRGEMREGEAAGTLRLSMPMCKPVA